MQTTFKVRETTYQASLAKREKSEEDKFHPYEVTVTGSGSPVVGTLNVTDSALESATAKAGQSGTSEEALLADACARSMAAEVLIRDLKPEFTFVVDHRWIK